MTLKIDGAHSGSGLKMTQKKEDSFKITIDARIVKVFESLPETFTIKQLVESARIPPNQQKSVYDQLERMVEYELIHKSKDKSQWYKDYEYRKKKTKQQVELDGFELWLLYYYRKIIQVT
jgi:Fe2+ or Zn2+ uptake regulation protein